MIKRFIILGLICVLVILDLLLLNKIQRIDNVAEQSSLLINRLQNEILEKQQYIDDISKIELLELEINNVDYCIDSVLMIEKTDEQPLFVYRFSSLSCQSCVDSMFVLFKSSSEELKRNMLIISDDKANNMLQVRLHGAGLDQMKYTISERLSLTFDTCNTPYCFILNDKMILSMLFIPDSRNRKRTIDYLKFVNQEYFIK